MPGEKCTSVSARRPCASRFFHKFFVSLLRLLHVLTSHNYSLTSVAWSKDSKLASGSDDSTVYI